MVAKIIFINKDMSLIGLVGEMRSGKTTSANILVERRGFVELTFAGPLKACIATLFDLDPGVFATQASKAALAKVIDHKYTHRQLLTTGGDALRTGFGKNLFVDIVDANIRKLVRAGKSVVISDVRYPVEAELVKKHGGKLVRLVRETEENKEEEEEKHSSETLQRGIDVDVTIHNNGTLDELRRALNVI